LYGEFGKDFSIFNYSKPNILSSPVKFNKRILVAPLDWGLGHATRCIPIIRLLMQSGCEVYLATSGKQEILLREEFPNGKFLHLPGYMVQYGKYGVMFRLLRQIPVIRRHIFTENAWLQQAVRTYGFDGILSDNRYGLYHHQIPSVLITHQINLQLPAWASIMRKTVQKVLFQHIEHFNECWIPDLPDYKTSLAGNLSHPKDNPDIPVKYIGWLSRFEPPASQSEREDTLLISLSGPEPQRTILEEKVLRQIKVLNQPIWLVRGLPGESNLPNVPGHVTVYNHLAADNFMALMQRCSLMISRSGYSTLMDAMVLGTPIACIPTPGQTEQEYLSKRLAEKGWAVCQTQDAFNLAALKEQSKLSNNPINPASKNEYLNEVLGKWLGRI
jgi:uncharacterized protein (TIGR00661 family)